MQPRLFFCLDDGASDPVDVGSQRLDPMRAQPAEQIAGFDKVLAIAEDFSQPVGFLRDARQQFVRVTVTIRHETKIGRLCEARWRIITLAILQRVVRKHRKAGEMNRLELAKRHEWIGWIREPRLLRESHRLQKRSQTLDVIVWDFRNDNKPVLRNHAPFRLYFLKSSAKSINRSLSQ